MRFKNKVVLVTGAGVGIGRATAIQFAKEGAKVAVNSLTAKNGMVTLEMVKELGAQAIFVQGDVSNGADAQRMVEETVSRFGRVDVLINNAGIVSIGAACDTAEDDWDRTMAVNLKGVFLVSKYAIENMIDSGGGVIVNNASAAAIIGTKNRCAYSASKGGVVSLSKSIATDYLKQNIRVNCVCPGTTDTPSLKDRINDAADPKSAEKEFVSRQPMGRFGTDEEIASAILFAACDETAFMNGAVISIDGGMTSLGCHN